MSRKDLAEGARVRVAHRPHTDGLQLHQQLVSEFASIVRSGVGLTRECWLHYGVSVASDLYSETVKDELSEVSFQHAAVLLACVVEMVDRLLFSGWVIVEDSTGATRNVDVSDWFIPDWVEPLVTATVAGCREISVRDSMTHSIFSVVGDTELSEELFDLMWHHLPDVFGRIVKGDALKCFGLTDAEIEFVNSMAEEWHGNLADLLSAAINLSPQTVAVGGGK